MNYPVVHFNSAGGGATFNLSTSLVQCVRFLKNDHNNYSTFVLCYTRRFSGKFTERSIAERLQPTTVLACMLPGSMGTGIASVPIFFSYEVHVVKGNMKCVLSGHFKIEHLNKAIRRIRYHGDLSFPKPRISHVEQNTIIRS